MTGFEMENKYRVCNTLGQQVYFASESECYICCITERWGGELLLDSHSFQLRTISVVSALLWLYFNRPFFVYSPHPLLSYSPTSLSPSYSPFPSPLSSLHPTLPSSPPLSSLHSTLSSRSSTSFSSFLSLPTAVLSCIQTILHGYLWQLTERGRGVAAV